MHETSHTNKRLRNNISLQVLLAIVAAIVNMARALALRVVAEGVETQEQLTILRELGCDEHQGYFYSRPLPADKLLTQLAYPNNA